MQQCRCEWWRADFCSAGYSSVKSSLTAQGRVREGRVWVPAGVWCRMWVTTKSTDAGCRIWDLHHLVDVPEKSRGFIVRVHHMVCSPWKQLGLEAWAIPVFKSWRTHFSHEGTSSKVFNFFQGNLECSLTAKHSKMLVLLSMFYVLLMTTQMSAQTRPDSATELEHPGGGVFLTKQQTCQSEERLRMILGIWCSQSYWVVARDQR